MEDCCYGHTQSQRKLEQLKCSQVFRKECMQGTLLKISIDKRNFKLREASQVGEEAKESRRETLSFHFMDYTRKSERSKSSEEISRSSKER